MPIVKSYNITLIGFNEKVIHHGNPNIRVTLENAYGYYTDPAPISPTDATDPDSAWTVMAGTARGMWASRKEVSNDGKMVELKAGEDLIMSPFMSTGVSQETSWVFYCSRTQNTDTRRYWDLTKFIYRFRYFQMKEGHGGHTINEHIVSTSDTRARHSSLRADRR